MIDTSKLEAAVAARGEGLIITNISDFGSYQLVQARNMKESFFFTYRDGKLEPSVH